MLNKTEKRNYAIAFAVSTGKSLNVGKLLRTDGAEALVCKTCNGSGLSYSANPYIADVTCMVCAGRGVVR